MQERHEKIAQIALRTGARIETMKRKRNMKGGRNAQTIEILLRADHR